MDGPSATLRDLARRLLAVEAASQSASDSRPHEAVRVLDKLREALTRLAGSEGFAALLRRTIILTRREAPAAAKVSVAQDGRVVGLEELAADGVGGIEAAAAMTAYLLWLLTTFIGQPLTLQIVRETWPGADWQDSPATDVP